MSATFGEVLREKRRASGVSQRRLAELAGVDFSYISKLENDRLPAPSAETVVRFANAIGASPEQLLAAARKMPEDVGKQVSREPAAQRFLRLASSMKLSGAEWEDLVGKLESLREGEAPERGQQ